MRAIKLHFTNPNDLTTLMNDANFCTNIRYLSPNRLDNNNLALFDPVTQHNALDTEIVVLTKFSRAIKNLLFPNTNYGVEFLHPILGEQKGGLVHNGTSIIDSTDIEIINFQFTIN